MWDFGRKFLSVYLYDDLNCQSRYQLKAKRKRDTSEQKKEVRVNGNRFPMLNNSASVRYGDDDDEICVGFFLYFVIL